MKLKNKLFRLFRKFVKKQYDFSEPKFSEPRFSYRKDTNKKIMKM